MPSNEFFITWKYLVEQMKERFGIEPDSEEKYPMGLLESKLDEIWDDYVYKKLKS